MFIVYLFIFFTGLALGSFMSVLVARLDVKKGIVAGRSECPNCSTQLKWYDLIPLVSYLMVRGKCRYCKEHISFLYPAMELSVAISFLLFFLVNGVYLNIESLYGLLMIFLLLALVFSDYKYFILPDKLIFTALAVSLVYVLAFKSGFLINGLLTGLGLGGFFAIIYIISRGEWMGFGDVKLAFLIGFILGFPAGLFSIIFSVWIGALWGVLMMVISRANLKTALPFGSFMGVVAILFLIFNEYIRFLPLGI